MTATHTIVRGIVKNGIVIPDSSAFLPEGASVEILLMPTQIADELKEDFAAWERAGDEAWNMIDELEKEEDA